MAKNIASQRPGNRAEAESPYEIEKIRPRAPGQDVVSAVSRKNNARPGRNLAIVFDMQRKKGLSERFWRGKRWLFPPVKGPTGCTIQYVNGHAEVLRGA